ncbi:MAG: hypothetical protein QOH90_532, partial [Actinomycetota bacterium]|nr:hypothetical protein [Actinomycetota bacterium]
MNLTVIADGRSPIARNWISTLVDRGVTVDVLSTYVTPERLPEVRSWKDMPLRLNKGAPSAGGATTGKKSLLGRLPRSQWLFDHAYAARRRLGP